jgi:predicted ATPase
VAPSSALNLFILTGAPGSGKTAILSRLIGEFDCVDEPAREVLAEQRATGGRGTWDQDPSLFVQLLLQRSIEKYETAQRSDRTVVFDRGIPDCAVYSLQLGTDPTHVLDSIDVYRYQSHVFFLEPWRGIYQTDGERLMPFDDTVWFSEALKELYDRSGYCLVEVPRGSVDDRAAFLRTMIARFATSR